MDPSIKWPAIVQYENSDELEIIENQNALNALGAASGARLISHNGEIYNLVGVTGGSLALITTNSTLALDHAVQMARKHMATQGQCCVSKFNACTIEDVIETLLASDDL